MNDQKNKSTKKKSDHRTRVGEQRRDRMKARLISAVMSVYARKSEHVTPVIEDIIAEAKVSRGTFYQYFDSIEDAAEELGDQLINSMTVGLEPILGTIQDPLLKLTTSIQIRLFRGVIDPDWGGFVSRTDYLSTKVVSRHQLIKDFIRAKKSDQIFFDDVNAAMDLVVGSCQLALKRMSKGEETSRVYIEELVVMILCGLGVDADKARDIVRERTIYIRGLAPDHLNWWRDPWSMRHAGRQPKD